MSQTSIEIKGVKDGLLVTVPDGPWDDVGPLLFQHLEEQQSFLTGAQIILQLHQRQLGAVELGKLSEKFADLDLNLWTVLSESAHTESAARSYGLETSLPVAELPPLETDPEPDSLDPNCRFVGATLRGGQEIDFDGNVVILGDIKVGARVIATGSIVVWGRLQGTAIAGAEGDESAVICALDLSPRQLNIAGFLARAPERDGAPEPEMACIKDGQIVAEPWVSLASTATLKKKRSWFFGR